MIAALWANSGFEGQEGANARRSAIEDLESHYDDAVQQIFAGSQPDEDQEDPYGFFQAGKRGVAKLEEPRDDSATVKEVIEYEVDQD